MAKINQTKIEAMCANVNSAGTTYVTNMQNSIPKFTNAFNENWVANDARALAGEIVTCVTDMQTKVTETFGKISEIINTNISNFNSEYQESCSFEGFSVGSAEVKIELNEKLDDGSTGTADNAVLDSIKIPMEEIKTHISTLFSTVANEVVDAGFSAAENTAIQNLIADLKTQFNQSANNVYTSLSDRIAEEKKGKQNVDDTNVSNLTIASE